MDFAVPLARSPVVGDFEVPPSKSIHQRALVLAALADGESQVVARGGASGEDVRHLGAALDSLGRWSGRALGTSREPLALHLGEGATGFRFCAVLSALRPERSRTLVRGTPSLLRRPHLDLLRAIRRLGGRAKRRRSGALRVLGGGLRGGRLSLSGRRSSQYASALLLAAPRMGGLEVRFVERPVSVPYLDLTVSTLRAFGVGVEVEALHEASGTIRVREGAPRGGRFEVPPDASSATVWWTAAALTGGRVAVPGLVRSSPQADVALLPLLEAMGCRVASNGSTATVEGPAGGLRSAGEADLRDSPDVLPLLAVLAARAEGTTRIRGVEHARLKETNRVEGVAGALAALGGRARVEGDALVVEGGGLHGGTVDARRDHRLAFAFGALGLVVPGIVLRGADSARKSYPGFLRDLSRAAGGAGS